MTRAALLLSSLFVAACTVGELPRSVGGDGTQGTDAGTNPGTDGGQAANACVDRVPAAQADAAHDHSAAAGGGTKAGQACLNAGCHAANNPGAGAPGYQFAGTVYKPGGTIPSVGATVRVKSGPGVQAPPYLTDSAGNFHIPAGALMNAFPGATVNVTACPTVAPMVTPLAQGDGNCAKAGCHVAGATGPITLMD